jgi:hypothetical protein
MIVCYGEFEDMKVLVGSDRAQQIMKFWESDHYGAIYRLVLDHEADIGSVVERHRLFPPV